MGVEFKDKIMLYGFREVNCRWETGEAKGGKVVGWQGGKDERVVS